MPDTYGTVDYPNITFADGHVLISRDFNSHHPPAAIWTIRGLPVMRRPLNTYWTLLEKMFAGEQHSRR